jgi:hypothetical protein
MPNQFNNHKEEGFAEALDQIGEKANANVLSKAIS